MSGLKNIDLEKLLKKIIGSEFLGVFPSDIIPNTRRKRFCVVFNLSPHDEPGSHFVAVARFPSKITYFDSFGKPCEEGNIQNFMSSFELPIEYSKRKIQNEVSIFCGIFCILFLCVCFKMNKPFSYLTNIFPEETSIKNDVIAVNFIVKNIKLSNMKK